MPINPSTACMRSLWSWFWSQAATGLFPLTHVACSNPNLQMIRFRSRSIHFPIPHEYSKGVKQLYSMETTCRILYSNSYEYLKKKLYSKEVVASIHRRARTQLAAGPTFITIGPYSIFLVRQLDGTGHWILPLRVNFLLHSGYNGTFENIHIWGF